MTIPEEFTPETDAGASSVGSADETARTPSFNIRCAMAAKLAAPAFVAIGVVACGNAPDSSPADVPPDVPLATVSAFPSSQQRDPAQIAALWSRSCALCHVDGTAGAPVAGNAEDWAARLARGRQTLLARTIEGYNNMPPLGYCMACETADFEALIDLMTAGLGEAEPQP